MRVGRKVLGVLSPIYRMQAGGSDSLRVGQIGNRREVLKNRSPSGGIRHRRAIVEVIFVVRKRFETDSSSAPADEEPETEDEC